MLGCTQTINKQLTSKQPYKPTSKQAHAQATKLPHKQANTCTHNHPAPPSPTLPQIVDFVWGVLQNNFTLRVGRIEVGEVWGCPSILWMDEIMHHCETMVETMVCWYLRGSHQRPGFLNGGAKWISSIHFFYFFF